MSARWIALTGTPGTGKSSVARRLARWRPAEVGDIARDVGAARAPRRGSVEVDVARLRERWPKAGRSDRVVVGHLAHFAPLRDVVVLRCDPVELARRLGGARRGTIRSRYENAASEAIDLIAIEARTLRRRIWQVDTTGRSVPAVAREIRSILVGRRSPAPAGPDWLADRRVTDWLLQHRP
jgi:adenylate kinase